MRNITVILVSIISLGITNGCAYRFSNLHYHAPAGASTISVEGIYDTGKTIWPHEVLWEEVQHQIAISGKLRLVSQRHADLYLRLHITDSKLNPISKSEEKTKDPENFKNFELEKIQPHPITRYKNLGLADTYSLYEQLQFDITAELWDLRNEKMLMKKKYQGLSKYLINIGKTPEHNFLAIEESLQKATVEASEKIAKSIVYHILTI